MDTKLIFGGAFALVNVSLYAAEKPNMLLFIADDHGFEQSEPYGSNSVLTPNMQIAADMGLVFDCAYVASPASGPSRGALLSGLMSARNGAISNHRTPMPQTQTMISTLKAQGYEVVAFGKVAHSDKQADMCDFDMYNMSVNNDYISVALKKYLDQRSSTKPICVMVGDRRPHVPWTGERTYDPSKMEIPSYLIDTPETREHWAMYQSEITAMDSSIGRVREIFNNYLGNENYLFVYTSDHGAQWPFGKWNLYERGVRTPLIVSWPGHIEAGGRTNAMVSWIDLIPTFIDLAGGKSPEGIDGESFAEVLRDPKSKHRDEIHTTHTSDGTMNLYPIRAMRDKEFKYIRNLRPDCYHSNHSDIQRKENSGEYWFSWEELAKTDSHAAEVIEKYYKRPAEELYNLEDDPQETNNLANDPKYSTKLEEMRSKVDSWITSQGDKLPLPPKSYPLAGPTPYEVRTNGDV